MPKPLWDSSDELSMMQVARFAPSPDLAPHVRVFEVVETREAATRTLFPEAGLVVGFRFAGDSTVADGGAGSLPHEILTGLRSTVRRMQTAANSGIVVAKLHPSGASRFFAQPLHEVFGKACALAELAEPRAVATAAQRIAESNTSAERVAAFEQFLRGRLRAERPDLAMIHALSRIAGDPTGARVAAIARDLGLSVDVFEKRFRRTVGASPKRFASIVRFRRGLALRERVDTLTQLSLEAGYYDQSHFVREFRSVTGLPPGRFFATERHC